MTSKPGQFVRLATLALLYFVQGAPYGFQVSCLPIVLREAGLSYTALGAMKLLFLPWVCKPLYAPFIEQTKTKLWWLTVSMIALGSTCIYAALFTQEDFLFSISVLMFALNLFSAGQDVATDSLAVVVLPEEELGVGNTVQVVAYKAGSVFAGGLLLAIREYGGWSGMFFGFACVYFLGLALLRHLDLVGKSTKTANSGRNENSEKTSQTNSGYSEVIHQVFSVRGTFYILLFVSFYKLCERGEPFTVFMVDKGVPKPTIAAASTIVRALSLLGSTYSGYRLHSNPECAKDILLKFSALRTVPIVGYVLVLNFWGTDKALNPETAFNVSSWDSFFMYSGFACTGILLFCAGAVTTAAFTIMMRLSQKAPENIQGTHYTTLATFEILGKLAFASVSGAIIDHFGLKSMYCLCVILAAICIPLIKLMPSDVSGEKEKK